MGFVIFVIVHVKVIVGGVKLKPTFARIAVQI